MRTDAKLSGEWLDRLVSVAIIVTSVAVLAAAAKILWAPSPGGGGSADQVRALEGEPVPSFAIETADGDTMQLPGDARGGYILIYHRTTCRYCVASVPAWKALVDACRVPIVFVSLEPAAQQSEAYQIGSQERRCSPRYGTPLDTVQFLLDYRARGTPIAYAISRKGLIESIWVGALPDPAGTDGDRSALLLSGAIR